jgi:hypothetical protein
LPNLYFSQDAAQLITQIGEYSEWILLSSLLFVVSWVRFNSPPSNRSGTTFALFFFGVIFYYALIVALWLLLTIAISQGSIGLSYLPGVQFKLGSEGVDQYKAAFFAVLFIVVASQFPTVNRIDEGARAFCMSLAAIPREADRIAVELAQTAFMPRSEQLRDQVTKFVSENVSAKALKFAGDSTLEARFTRTVGLYNLFIAPKNSGTQLAFPAGPHARSAYAAIMQLSESVAARAEERFEELIQAGLAYFTSEAPTKMAKDGLSRAIADESNLVCTLIARYVLYCDRTALGRRQRLSHMGFDRSHPMPSFGLDKWAMTIVAVILMSVLVMTVTGAKAVDSGKILMIAITFSITIGFAVMGAVVVAQRFIERRENGGPSFPPFAELILAGLIVAGLSLVTRLAIPLLPAVIQGDSSGVQAAITQFSERWPGIIVPFTCTISLGLLCSYVGSLKWSLWQVSVVAAMANGCACMAGGAVLASLLPHPVLAQIYERPDQAKPLIVVSTGLIGAAIGAMVLAAFRQSERVRKDVAESVVNTPHPSVSDRAPGPFGKVELPPCSDAAQNLGGYRRENVKALEGRYLCLRPAFSVRNVIAAYVVTLHWEASESCLIFEEQGRVDARYTQRGRVYIPDGKPYMSLLTVEGGAIRLIMISRPDGGGSARGLITTLSNPGGVQFTPVSAPLVMKRLASETDTPQLGFIKSETEDYASYSRELEAVTPDYAYFTIAPGGPGLAETRTMKGAEEVRLSIVR